MKYGVWCEQEGADTKKKKEKKKPLLMHEVHTEEVSPRKSHGPAEADSGDEETTHADIQHALQKGTYKPPGVNRWLKHSLERHLSRSRHKKAAGVPYPDAPSDAQMMFVYDAVKKSPMVPPLQT